MITSESGGSTGATRQMYRSASATWYGGGKRSCSWSQMRRSFATEATDAASATTNWRTMHRAPTSSILISVPLALLASANPSVGIYGRQLYGQRCRIELSGSSWSGNWLVGSDRQTGQTVASNGLLRPIVLKNSMWRFGKNGKRL